MRAVRLGGVGQHQVPLAPTTGLPGVAPVGAHGVVPADPTEGVDAGGAVDRGVGGGRSRCHRSARCGSRRAGRTPPARGCRPDARRTPGYQGGRARPPRTRRTRPAPATPIIARVAGRSSPKFHSGADAAGYSPPMMTVLATFRATRSASVPRSRARLVNEPIDRMVALQSGAATAAADRARPQMEWNTAGLPCIAGLPRVLHRSRGAAESFRNRRVRRGRGFPAGRAFSWPPGWSGFLPLQAGVDLKA